MELLFTFMILGLLWLAYCIYALKQAALKYTKKSIVLQEQNDLLTKNNIYLRSQLNVNKIEIEGLVADNLRLMGKLRVIPIKITENVKET